VHGGYTQYMLPAHAACTRCPARAWWLHMYYTCCLHTLPAHATPRVHGGYTCCLHMQPSAYMVAAHGGCTCCLHMLPAHVAALGPLVCEWSGGALVPSCVSEVGGRAFGLAAWELKTFDRGASLCWLARGGRGDVNTPLLAGERWERGDGNTAASRIYASARVSWESLYCSAHLACSHQTWWTHQTWYTAAHKPSIRLCGRRASLSRESGLTNFAIGMALAGTAEACRNVPDWDDDRHAFRERAV